MNKASIKNFIGRQLSRLRLGQTYYSIIITTVGTISLVSLAFHIDFSVLIILFPIILFGAFMIGMILDKWDISSLDYRKTNEMSSRYMNTTDKKNFEFQSLQTEILVEVLKKIGKNEKVDFEDILKDKKENFYKKWNPLV